MAAGDRISALGQRAYLNKEPLGDFVQVVWGKRDLRMEDYPAGLANVAVLALVAPEANA